VKLLKPKPAGFWQFVPAMTHGALALCGPTALPLIGPVNVKLVAAEAERATEAIAPATASFRYLSRCICNPIPPVGSCPRSCCPSTTQTGPSHAMMQNTCQGREIGAETIAYRSILRPHLEERRPGCRVFRRWRSAESRFEGEKRHHKRALSCATSSCLANLFPSSVSQSSSWRASPLSPASTYIRARDNRYAGSCGCRSTAFR